MKTKSKIKLIKCDVTIDPEGTKYPKMHLQYLVETEFEKKLIDIPEAVLPLSPSFLIKEQTITDYCRFLSSDAIRYSIRLDDDSCPLQMAEGELSDQSYAYAEKILKNIRGKCRLKRSKTSWAIRSKSLVRRKGKLNDGQRTCFLDRR